MPSLIHIVWGSEGAPLLVVRADHIEAMRWGPEGATLEAHGVCSTLTLDEADRALEAWQSAELGGIVAFDHSGGRVAIPIDNIHMISFCGGLARVETLLGDYETSREEGVRIVGLWEAADQPPEPWDSAAAALAWSQHATGGKWATHVLVHRTQGAAWFRAESVNADARLWTPHGWSREFPQAGRSPERMLPTLRESIGWAPEASALIPL